jgi:hypothetical protein
MMDRNARPARLADDGGAVIIEMALLLPLLVILVSGIIDFGGAYRQRTVVQAAARNAARAGATASGLKTVMNGSPVGTRPGAYYADQVALASLVAGLSGSSNITVDKIIIYRANPQADGKPSSGCIDAAAVPGGNPEMPTEELGPNDLAKLDEWVHRHAGQSAELRTASSTTIQTSPPPTRIEAGLRVCPRCGQPIHLGADACRKCGTAVPKR